MILILRVFILTAIYLLCTCSTVDARGIEHYLYITGGESPDSTRSSTAVRGTSTDSTFEKTKQSELTLKTKLHIKKWLSHFSKLDANQNRVLTYYGYMLAGF